MARVKLTLDPELWGRIRAKAFEQGRTASSLVEEVLEHWLRYGFPTQIERRLSSDRQGRDVIAETVTGDQVHRDGSITLHEVSLVEDTPEGRAAGSGQVVVGDQGKERFVPPPGVVRGSDLKLPPGADGGSGIGVARPAPKPTRKRR